LNFLKQNGGLNIQKLEDFAS